MYQIIQTKPNLNALDVHNKEFSTRVLGCDRDQVNEFIDTVIKDYEFFDKTIKQLKRENEELRIAQQLQENNLIDRVRELEIAQWGRSKG
ncbi:DivIVA domain-containing protein [Paenibacillus sp. LS1]|uniref:DivIVA domain-containing protein n=1 Tax=Paenibacillus sp. LS1 TaxID=2992120 RepID=UPI0029F45ADD|nr:DivIVA domain-containing protein [Paenibacillus sp. LS1]